MLRELTKNTRFIVTFEWEETRLMPSIQTIENEKIVCFHYDGKTFRKQIRYPEFVVGVDDRYWTKMGKIGKKMVEGVATTTLYAVSFEELFAKKSMPFEVNGQVYAFETAQQQYDEHTDTVFVTMVKKDARKIHYIGADYAKLTQKFTDICMQKNEEEQGRMKQALRRWEEATITAHEQEKKKKAYAQLSRYKRFMGGQQLKDKYQHN